MVSIAKKLLPSSTRRILKKILHFETKSTKKIKKLNQEIDALKYQIEYFKRHFDIQQMKPATGYLRNVQLRELAFTQEVLKLLEPYGIQASIDGGALLGACRHKGFIPWDDDIDLCVMREDFNKIIILGKKNFVWIDSSKKDCFSAKFYDMAIRENPGKYVFIQTPFCLHIFKGTSLKDAGNVEFVPYDYLKEDVTEEHYLSYRKKICDFVHSDHSWKEKFSYYETELTRSEIYSKTQTSRIVPGLGNWDFTEYNFFGFRNRDDLFPLQQIPFENKTLPGPNRPYTMLDKAFGKNWMQFPKDVGVAHTLQEQNHYFKSIGSPIDFNEF